MRRDRTSPDYPQSQQRGALTLTASPSYLTSQPVAADVTVSNPTTAFQAYHVEVTLLQNDEPKEPSLSWDVTVHGGQTSERHQFSFGPQPLGIYLVKAELQQAGTDLTSAVASVVIYGSDDQIQARSQASVLTDAALGEFDDISLYVAGTLADSDEALSKVGENFMFDQMMSQAVDAAVGPLHLFLPRRLPRLW